MATLTEHDWNHLRETFRNAQSELACGTCNGGVDPYDGEGCDDCQGLGSYPYEGETVMTSIGYVGLQSDGAVIAFGKYLGNVQESEQ